MRAFLAHPRISAVRAIIHPDDLGIYGNAVRPFSANRRLLDPAFGGAERQESVRLGLESVASLSPSHILIHDGARPFVDNHVIDRILDALGDNEGAIAALPVHDTIKKSDGDARPHIAGTVSRDGLWRAQTPQGFAFGALLAAHQSAKGKMLTDDAAVAEAAGIRVRLVPGSPDNMKITQAEDFGMAELILGRRQAMYEYRTGHGYDVHQFERGEGTTLCGVTIPHSAKLKGHSDADAGMHALTDAILGALAAGDIGDHFPPSDPRWKGAPSRIFLERACALVHEAGGSLTHLDVTLVCEAPRIGPHRAAMRQALSDITGLSVDRISVKATTTEELGFTGRREGLAAFATATIRLPSHD